MAKDILVKDKKRLSLHTWSVEEGFSTIGRDPGSRFVLDHPSVSRSHGAFFLRERAGVLTIEDHGSTNGTLVNGVPVKRKILFAGDVVQIGDFQLYILQGSAAQGQPGPGTGWNPAVGVRSQQAAARWPRRPWPAPFGAAAASSHHS